MRESLITYFDNVPSTLCMTKHLLQTWNDEFLHWNKTYYRVDVLTVDAKRIWIPEVIIFNRYTLFKYSFLKILNKKTLYSSLCSENTHYNDEDKSFCPHRGRG